MGKPLELVVIRVIGVEVKEVSDQPHRHIREQKKRLLVREAQQFGRADSWTKNSGRHCAGGFGDAFEA